MKNLFAKKPASSQRHPMHDWLLLVLVALLLLAASAAWNVWLFWEVSNGKSLGGTPATSTQTKTQTITDVQDVFKSRATERVNYQKNYSFIDPAK